jgi:hypothetical protein
MTSTPLKATLRRPTGFSYPSHHSSEVTVVGFCYGHHTDARSYGRQGDTVLAICVDECGHFNAFPLHWLQEERS